MADDEKFMARALALAEKGRGSVEPNPVVGCVLVREGKVVAEGFHERFGGPHAEVRALEAAGEQAAGATMYVNLEPCCHQGKTPPCVAAIVRAGVRRVVIAYRDPNPLVAGKGIEALKQHGVVVRVGVLEEQARRVNAPYLKLITRGIPYVHAKWAMSMDGKIATVTRRSKWISSEASRAAAHAMRGRMDAIIVGINTVFMDDPLLTARPPGPRTPVRIVLDSMARLPGGARVLQTLESGPVLLAVGPDAPAERVDALEKMGCECLRLTQRDRCVRALELLRRLGERQMTNVLVEGGAEVLGSFFRSGEVDEVHVFLAPKVLGGASALTAVAGPGFPELHSAPQYTVEELKPLGPDVYIRARRNDAS